MRLTEFDTDKSTLNEAGPAVVAAPAGYAVFWALARAAGFASARAYAQHILRNPKTYSSVLNSAAGAFAKVDGMLGNNTLYPVDKSANKNADAAIDKKMDIDNAASQLKSAADAARSEATPEIQDKVQDIMQSDVFTQAPVQPSFSAGDTVSYTSRRNKDGATGEFVQELPNGMVQLKKDGATFAIDPVNIDTSTAARAPNVTNVQTDAPTLAVPTDNDVNLGLDIPQTIDKPISKAAQGQAQAPAIEVPPTIANLPPEAKPVTVGPTSRGRAGAKAGAGTAASAGTQSGAQTGAQTGAQANTDVGALAVTRTGRLKGKGKGKDKPDLPSRDNTDQVGNHRMMQFSPIDIKDPLSLKSTRSTYAPN